MRYAKNLAKRVESIQDKAFENALYKKHKGYIRVDKYRRNNPEKSGFSLAETAKFSIRRKS